MSEQGSTLTYRPYEPANGDVTEALRIQWEYNHDEHCNSLDADGVCPYVKGDSWHGCLWPRPPELRIGG